MSQKYFSDELAAIDTEAHQVVSSHLDSLDKVSNDIKALEATLRKAAIPFTFVYLLFSEKQHIGDTMVYCEVCAKVYSYEDHCLVWSQTNKGTRLSYNVYKTRKEYNADNNLEIGDGRPSTWLDSSTPLIETKAFFRLQVKKELPFFYKGIIEKLDQNKKDDVCFLRSPFYKENSYEKAFPDVECNYEFLGISPPRTKPFSSLED